jgi:hypothetical protein
MEANPHDNEKESISRQAPELKAEKQSVTVHCLRKPRNQAILVCGAQDNIIPGQLPTIRIPSRTRSRYLASLSFKHMYSS